MSLLRSFDIKGEAPWFTIGANLLNSVEQVCTCKQDTIRQGGRVQVKCVHLIALNQFLESKL